MSKSNKSVNLSVTDGSKWFVETPQTSGTFSTTTYANTPYTISIGGPVYQEQFTPSEQITDIEEFIEPTNPEEGYKNQEKLDPTAAGILFKSLRSVTPQELIDKLDGIASYDAQVQWTVGDAVNDIYLRAKSSKLANKYNFNDVCFFVSIACLGGSRSYSTVKGYAITTRRFPPNLRVAFNYTDIPFSHFTYAGQDKFEEVNKNTKNPYWMDILCWSYDQSLIKGRKISERELRDEFEHRVPSTRKTSFKIGASPNVSDYSRPILNIPDEEASTSDLVVNQIENICVQLENLAEYISVNFPNNISQPYSQAVLFLKQVLGKLGQIQNNP